MFYVYPHYDFMKKLELDENIIVTQYKNNKSIQDISKSLGCSDMTIRNRLINNNIYIRGRNQQKVYPLEDKIFDKLIDDYFFHYFLGFYVGDGDKGKEFINKGRFSIGLRITNENESLLNDFRKILVKIKNKTDQYFETQGTAKIKKRYLYHKKAKKQYGMIQLRVGLRTLKFKLDEFGLNINKNKCFTIPKYYYKNKDKFGSFLAGLIDADGCFNFNKKLTSTKISIALGDLKSCEDLQKIIKNCYDIDTNIRKQKNFNIFFFNCNHSYKKGLINFKLYNQYIFPHIRLKTKQINVMRLIYNAKLSRN